MSRATRIAKTREPAPAQQRRVRTTIRQPQPAHQRKIGFFR